MRMITQHFTAYEPAGPAFSELAAAGVSPRLIADYKRDRLFELRAMVNSLRRESDFELLTDVFAESANDAP
jgi:hypothetical protein